MSRQPKAREKVIQASRQIVMERGAGCLTFEEIAQVSGVTRGGITYHFPTKQQLLCALVDHDLAQWKAIEEELRPDDCDSKTSALLAYIRAHTGDDPERRRFVTGMLGAAALDPPILEPARAFEQRRIQETQWDEQALKDQLLRMAAFGMFWAQIFDCPSMPADVRSRLVALLEQLAVEWSAGEAAPPAQKKNPQGI
jgi:AcrR family transcriptional regulator